MAEAVKKAKLSPSFVICSCASNYNGTHPSRVRFEGGVGRTTDPAAAEHCRAAGLAVFDETDEADERAFKAFVRKRDEPKRDEPKDK